jgi:hypothetical protein
MRLMFGFLDQGELSRVAEQERETEEDFEALGRILARIKPA